MLLLSWRDEHGNPSSAVAREFPLLIGRAGSAHLRIEAPGIWEHHATIRLQEGRFVIGSEGEALLIVNGEAVREKTLVPGDVLQLGASTVLASLAPARHSALAPREFLFWGIVLLLSLLEIVLALTAT